MNKQTKVFAAATTLLAVVLVAAFINYGILTQSQSGTKDKPVHIGVSFCGNTTTEAKLLIDKVKNYTNLFILQSGPISRNQTALDEISSYATQQGLDLIVYFGWFDVQHDPWQLPWIQTAMKTYGDRLLGIYYYDEPGGLQLDYNWTHYFSSNLRISGNYTLDQARSEGKLFLNGSLPRDYVSATEVYLSFIRNDYGLRALQNISVKTFVSEYALHWYAYVGGWDVVLAQIGWNNSAAQDIALVRGAATLQNKEWGAIITWKYDEPPYLDSGEEIYKQMEMAYTAGADYIAVFNYPQNDSTNPYGVMKPEHFQALQTLYNNIQSGKIVHGSTPAQAAYVLPPNYGWAMRRPDDKIWYWDTDELSPKIWNDTRQLLTQYGLGLDLVYCDPHYPLQGNYSTVYYWNQTIQKR